jgi:proliferating cell nuclear antigen PCNA
MEFELFRHADAFASILQYIKTMADMVEIRVDADRLYFQTMDASHISVAEVSLPNDWFDAFSVADTPVAFGVNVGILHKIVSIRDKDQSVFMQYEPDHGVLDITIRGGAATKQFELHLADIGADSVNIPEVEYAAEMTLESTMLSNTVSQLRLFGDVVTIECSEVSTKLGSANELGRMSVEVSVDDMEAFAINEGAELAASYSLAHLHTFLSFHKISRAVEVRISPEYPLQLIYSVGQNATLKFFLAPKIETE